MIYDLLLKEEDEQEINHLCEEATMPIEDVIAKYNSGIKINITGLDNWFGG